MEGEICNREGYGDERMRQEGREKSDNSERKSESNLERRRSQEAGRETEGSKSIKCPAETFRFFIKFPRFLLVYPQVLEALLFLPFISPPRVRFLCFFFFFLLANNYPVLSYFEKLTKTPSCVSRKTGFRINASAW